MTTLFADRAEEDLADSGKANRTPGAPVPAATPISAFRTPELPEELLLLAAELLDVAGAKSTLLLAAADAGGSTTSCALDLGRALVQLGVGRVVVVEAAAGEPLDLPEPPRAGLLDLLAETLPLDRATLPVAPGLDLLPFRAEGAPGPQWPNLAGRALDRLVSTLRAQYDLVLISGPSLRENALARLLARKTEGVVLVAGRGRQTRSGLDRLHQQLRTAQVDVLGVILA